MLINVAISEVWSNFLVRSGDRRGVRISLMQDLSTDISHSAYLFIVFVAFSGCWKERRISLMTRSRFDVTVSLVITSTFLIHFGVFQCFVFTKQPANLDLKILHSPVKLTLSVLKSKSCEWSDSQYADESKKHHFKWTTKMNQKRGLVNRLIVHPSSRLFPM